MYNISKEDFADHVRQVKTWRDLAIRCGSYKENSDFKRQLKKKVFNMKLNIDHFRGQIEFPDDDVFIKMVEDSDCLKDIVKKCVSATGKPRHRTYFNRRIKDLCLDTSHWKITPIRTMNCTSKPMNMIDDETFKTILKNSINWTDLCQKCGYAASSVKHIVSKRIKKLGLDTKHLDCTIDNDKIFVVESPHQNANTIKKRLVRDFDRPYECSSCKNENFTTRDGVLMWNQKQIVLQLEHINGVHNDNRLENLTFLCPNCHAQTSTFCGMNGKKRKISQAWVEDGKID
jgi:hypothetical protein